MTQFYVTGPGTAATLGLANSNGWHTSQANIDFPSSITTTSIRTFSEANSTLINLNAGWANLTGTNQSLTAGQGFRAFIRGPLSGGNVQLGPLANAQSQAAFTLSLTGAINSGDITPPSLTNSQTGWNLLGNPYPCAYNFNAHYDAAIGSEIANIDPVVYAYNSTAGTPGYVSFNASSNTAAGLTGGIIPSGAGFFIQATGIPTFIFKETYKTTTASASVHKTDISYVEFGIKYSKDTLQGDYMVIKMFDGATLNSELYDIKKLQNEDLNLSAFGVDNVDLTASCIPFISEETRIKLNIEAVEVGTYKFDFTNMDNFDKGVSVSLLDKYNNKTTDVKANTKYTFEMGGDVNQWGKNRFELILNGKATTGVNNTIAKKAAITNLTVYPNPATDVLNISLSNGTVIEIVNIYTVSGKLVNNIKLNGNQIDISQLNNGVYMVEVLTADGSFKTKFVK
ncbi:MAG: T9SS type A sorting domain-containing protein [Candidatus Methylacidiphilales bacterium]